MRSQPLKQLKQATILSLTLSLTLLLPAGAEDPIFGKISLRPGFTPPAGTITGYTSGSTSLPAVVANSDYKGNKCLGFADKAPDYKMVLEQDFPKLQFSLNSGGKDTTLAIMGPDRKIRCGDDTGSSKDASITDTNWKAGEYSIWVGSIDPASQWNYKLTVQQ
ncbi:hypothetical protein NG798_11660 [Ancylothrix sp. C2]|uniref:hypothetical protein n=1 Tax=Ancylothrix sp. D3o TaxID=2953691 RepID=UPI0021BA7B73|nr:hypothetical protein [Ancylothrix sp. D3o]MCT7950448.1 hypothetical protein [Ancylothrix sp. D3o]